MSGWLRNKSIDVFGLLYLSSLRIEFVVMSKIGSSMGKMECFKEGNVFVFGVFVISFGSFSCCFSCLVRNIVISIVGRAISSLSSIIVFR